MDPVVVIQHEPQCPPDLLGEWLAAAGVEVQVVRADLGEAVPTVPPAGGLVVLGGHMGANDDAEFPWLTDVKALLSAAVDTGVPTLGICLGAQLLAVARGGTVAVGVPGIEAGVVGVAWRPDAGADPLVGGLADGFPGPSMHLDAITRLPADAVWLGSTEQYPHQAFRVGEAAWGVQFHPEASLATFARWGGMHADDWHGWGIDGEAVVEELAARESEVADAGRELVLRFAGLVRAD